MYLDQILIKMLMRYLKLFLFSQVINFAYSYSNCYVENSYLIGDANGPNITDSSLLNGTLAKKLTYSHRISQLTICQQSVDGTTRGDFLSIQAQVTALWEGSWWTQTNSTLNLLKIGNNDLTPSYCTVYKLDAGENITRIQITLNLNNQTQPIKIINITTTNTTLWFGKMDGYRAMNYSWNFNESSPLIGFWGFKLNQSGSYLQGLGVINYNTSCNPNTALLGNGTNLTFQAQNQSCIAKYFKYITNDGVCTNKTQNNTYQKIIAYFKSLSTTTIVVVSVFSFVAFVLIILLVIFIKRLRAAKLKALKNKQSKDESLKFEDSEGESIDQRPKSEQPYYKRGDQKKKVQIKHHSRTFRHFRALMTKNAINWRRTWCGSALEFICPIFLMLFLVMIRSIVPINQQTALNAQANMFPFYPAAKLVNPTTHIWSITQSLVDQQSASLYNFFNYAQYPNGVNNISGTYSAMADIKSPYQFMPPQCYTPGREWTNSPLIAVVNQSNTIQADVVSQLQALFHSQKITAKNKGLNSSPLGNFTIQYFNTTDELFTYIKDENYGRINPAICFGFQIKENNITDYELELFFNDLPPSYFVSLPSQQIPGADPSQQAPLIKEALYYERGGFNHMTNWVTNAILKKATDNPKAQIATMIIPMLNQPVKSDFFTQILQFLFPFFLMIIYIPVLYRTVYRIVFEKVSRAKESMRMMGMGDFAYWGSWLGYYTFVNLIISTVVWAILQINVFSRRSGPMIWLFLFLFGQSLFGLILIIQSLFSSPRAAAITTTVIYFGSSVLSTLVSNNATPRSTKIAVCWFFPTVTMITGLQPLIINDSSGIGVTVKTANIQYINFSVQDAIGLFIVGGIQMFVFGLYLEYVMPKTYGKKLHPCFCLSFLKKRKFQQTQYRSDIYNIDSSESEDEHQNQQRAFETKYLNKNCYEGVPREIQAQENQRKVLKIQGLRKVYENGFKAVDGVNLMMYSDQIFVLLGHNGAGKTTTISMLTGLFGASSGSAEIFGIDIFNNMDAVRQVIGICPQHDVLFELLTVYEHLSFFYDLKAVNPNPETKETEIKNLMKDVGIYDKRNSLAFQLSGGNKRKLSVAIALCGGSKFILLDEPTSGMDLQARRQLWNMLKEQKKGRIIVLTTHYMDEADILGDRIGIMASGKLTALGTSIFLKSKFGVGYNLVIVKANSNPNPKLFKYLQQNLGENVIKSSEIQQEMTVQIPLEYANKFAQFFQNFDKDLEYLQILNYGISISTLEEVFMKVGHLDDPTRIIDQNDEQLDQETDNKTERSLFNDNEKAKEENVFNLIDNVNELDLSFGNNLQAVLYKRFYNYKRNKRALFNEVVIPALIMILGIGVSKFQPSLLSPSRIQDPTRLPLPQQILFNPQPVVQTTIYNPQIIQQIQNEFPNTDDAFIINNSTWNSTKQQTNQFTYANLVYNFGTQNASTPPYFYGSYQIYQADILNQQYSFITYANLTSQDATGLYPIFMYQSLLKVATKNSQFNFQVRTTPYPPTKLIESRFAASSTSTICFVTAISYSLMITAVVSYLVIERTNGLKHLQIISGMQLKAYWIGNFIFDFFKFQVTIIITIILFFGFSMGYDNAIITYVLLPFGILPFTYATSFIFQSDSSAQTFTMFFHFLILGILSTLTFFLRLAPTLQKYGDAVNIILHIIPSYSIGSSLYCDSACLLLSQTRTSSTSTGDSLDKDVWSFYNISFSIIALFVNLFFWAFQIALIEQGFYDKFKIPIKPRDDPLGKSLDEDVVQEVKRVLNGNLQDIIQVKGLKKLYNQHQAGCCVFGAKPLIAVNNLTFSLTKGECFALLGVNGAGKSTTFKSLTCEVIPTQGTIKIAGIDVAQDFEEARKLIGYCPQQNLIFDEMSVEEHLFYYAKVKGIPQKEHQSMIETAIQNLGLGMHRLKTAGTLSGGNKRKLCVALALLGNPPIVFLDEPSAGMDPESRRFMWSVVGKVVQKKTSAVVLTTHSMDEAEALSTKMGIMVKGGIFKCFGTAQHIRSKFGTGYVIEIKIKTLSKEELENVGRQFVVDDEVSFIGSKLNSSVQQIIKNETKNLKGVDLYKQIHGDFHIYGFIHALCNTFQNVELLEKFGSYIRVRVARLDKSIGFLFGLVEEMRQWIDISEYSVSQTTLEQIFQGFANVQFTESIVKFELKPCENGSQGFELSVQENLTKSGNVEKKIKKK